MDRLAGEAGFWSDPEAAQNTLRRRSSLLRTIEAWNGLHKTVKDQAELLQLLQMEEAPDPSLVEEVDKALGQVEAETGRLEFRLVMDSEEDAKNAIVSVNAGAGGVESQDWAEMLLRMYMRWAEGRGYAARLISILPGEEAGVKNAIFIVQGEYAYGYLRAEVGVHRLVRISPFDASARRHTSFASVDVTPEVDDDVEIEINESDLRVDVYRSSGAGGQHVNTTDSAVRITHNPTGIVVTCQNERSQHKNRATAMKLLRAQLYELERRKREEEKEAQHALKKTIAFGSQIRSYVLHPYRLVKDHRTDVETSNVDAVLDGALDPFIDAYLLSLIEARAEARK
ncbi:MAG: peptide chain release factor 2 [Candidatus Tectomicrobia bacterium RIFCSPLOWO2_12_FULL_69_37]|nr:MAG: peptide chain release factor 2 [Candidatus Tectomicrobia bacterium RIFCSPLOWO2_02_FULL_70_19]OGL63553.1 MAG: peptide chain release factor 2 [Candidatus Tectomicrobia bacterium RIFCSPLOWO2_12_FULL_69_37]